MTPAARNLWLLFFVAVVFVTASLRLTGVTEGHTIIRPIRRFVEAFQQTDSWRPMRMAEEYLRGSYDRPVFDEFLNVRQIKFQYPLSSLLFTRHLSLSWLNTISWFSIIAIVMATWMILRRSGTGTPLEFRHDDPAVGLAVVGLTLSFYPIVEAYSLGQIQAWINALLALALLAWVARREDLAGVAVGLACLMKPNYLLFGLWALVRRRVKFLVPLVGVLVLGNLAALVAYGWSNNVDYLKALWIMGRHGEAFYPNQSFNGLLNRLLDNGDSLRFDRYNFAPFHPLVYAGTVATSIALISLALWLPKRWQASGSPTDFAIVMLTITMASPIAWTHHYGVLLPILAATAPAVLVKRPLGRLTAPTMLVAYIAVSQIIIPFNELAGTSLGILQSHLFIAALVVLGLDYATLKATQQQAK